MNPLNSKTKALRLLILLLLIGISYLPAFTQQADSPAGEWKGILKIPGFELEMNVTLDKSEDMWSGLLDIPQQGIQEMALSGLRISDDSIFFKLPEVPGDASFAGSFEEHLTVIKGSFTQMGRNLPLKLERLDELAMREEKERIDKVVAELKNLADSILIMQNFPGIGFGIIMDGEVILAEGFGYADVENKKPAHSNTLFAIGSCSKAFTSLGAAMLVEEGKLEWDKPVINYMHDFKLYDDFATKEMTTIDLLTHQSGLPRHDLMWYGSPMDRYELYSRLQYLPPSKSFRSTWQYQNLMFMTAGILIEHISNQSWEDFTKERIFDPLNMDHSYFSWTEIPDSEEIALGYTKLQDELSLTPYRHIVNVAPAGSINSNVNDMLKWVQMHLDKGKAGNNQLVKEETIHKIHHPHKVIENSESSNHTEISAASYGLGWGISYYRGTKTVSHGGGIDGFTALVYLLPHEDIGMVMLCNAGGASINTVLARTATDLLLEKEPIDWYARVYGEPDEDEEEEEQETKKKEPIAGTSPSHDLEDYAGIFEHPGYGKITITVQDDSLHLNYNAFDQNISHWHYDVFNIHINEINQDMLFSFHTNLDGYVDQISANLEPTMDEPFYFKKLPPDLMSAEYLSRILGEYILEGSGTNVKVSKTGDKLFATVSGQPPYELEPYQEDEFKLIVLSGYSVKFYFDDDYSKSTYLEFLQPNGIFKAVRKSE